MIPTFSMSHWYPMECGIHQGGYLSLVKYTAFIDSLITSLESSRLCSTIYRIPTSPVGYADDVAACTVSKRRMVSVMDKVYTHGNTWRYTFNAKKSAVLIFGETKRERKIGSENRVFSLGLEKVKEKLYYDHVGIKTCVQGDTHFRTDEKVAKARKVLNMSVAFGFKRVGLNISTSNLIYWTVIIPILCFGCEIWVLKKKDIELLSAFQRYAARRLQRFHTRSINVTSYLCLGWMSIINYIKALKLIFLRSIVVMKEYIPLRRILVNRINDFEAGMGNPYDSPLLYSLQICHDFDLYNNFVEMLEGNVPSKARWRQLVWDKAWPVEDDMWQQLCQTNDYLSMAKQVAATPAHSIWWQISDSDRSLMSSCEVMVRILCRATQFKEDDCRYKRATLGERLCILCELAAPDNAMHMIMQCPHHAQSREVLQREICEICPDFGTREVFYTILGKPLENVDDYSMVQIWKIACYHTSRMYWETIRMRKVALGR